MGRVDGKVVVITGGGGGIGSETARVLAREGAHVVLADVSRDAADAVAAEIGDAAAAVALDVTDGAQWDAAVAAAQERFGPVTGLVNAAGVASYSATEDLAEDEFRRVVDINQLGTFLGMKAVIPSMRAAGGGSIVNISSLAGLVGLPQAVAYTASKWAVRGMTKSVAAELGHDGIRVNAVFPGVIDTPLADAQKGLIDQLLPQLPLGASGGRRRSPTCSCTSSRTSPATAPERISQSTEVGMSHEVQAPLPLVVEDVTAEWLTQALSERYPGTVVESAEVDTIVWGTATKILLRLTYGQTGDTAPPDRLCVKAGFSPELRPLMAIGYQGEALFYRDLGPRIPKVPRSHFAAIDVEAQQGLVILDDLRGPGVTFGDPRNPLTPDQVAGGLEVLAQTHATDVGEDPPAWLGAAAHIRAMIGGLLTAEHWDAFIDTPRAAALRGDLRDRVRVAAGFHALWGREDTLPRCLTHGDANATNIYISATGDVAFLDWQFATLGHWAADVALFMVGAMTIDDRREHEQDLLRGYLAARGDGAPSFDDAWSEYRRRHIHGMTYAFTPEEMQPLAVCATFTERFAQAAEDHQTLDLLGV